MSALAPATEAALSGPAVVVAWALLIELPSATIRLLNGSGAVTIGGELYTGADETFGVLSTMEAVTDGMDDEAPSLRFVILPPTIEAMAALAAPGAQGSPVLRQFVVISPLTGQVIGDPCVDFVGELDVPTLKVGKNTRSLQFDCIGVFDKFFAGDEGARLNNAFHQSIWPGELGLEFISSITVRNPWGSDAPRTALTPNTVRY